VLAANVHVRRRRGRLLVRVAVRERRADRDGALPLADLPGGGPSGRYAGSERSNPGAAVTAKGSRRGFGKFDGLGRSETGDEHGGEKGGHVDSWGANDDESPSIRKDSTIR
jgi:hypothetical protein